MVYRDMLMNVMASLCAKLTSLVLTTALALLLTHEAGAVLLPRPQFNSERDFSVGASEDATWLSEFGPTSTARYAMYDQAARDCGLNAMQVRKKLDDLLASSGEIASALSKVFDWPLARLQQAQATIIIDSFSPGQHVFRMFYLRQYEALGTSGPAIVLDCLHQEEWASMLAHEITHVLLESSNIPSWLDEAAAQLMESDAGGSFPERSLAQLQHLKVVPRVYETERPLKSSASYAINYLVGRFLVGQFGGFETLRAMLLDSSPSHISDASVETLMERGQKNLAQRGLDTLAARLTPHGFLRFLAVATSLRDSTEPMYRIPGVSTGVTIGGVSPAPEPIDLNGLHPSQFARLAPGTQVPSSSGESYRILSWGSGLKIIPLMTVSHAESVARVRDIVEKVNGGAGLSQDFILWIQN
jgi:hypothetical protein